VIHSFLHAASIQEKKFREAVLKIIHRETEAPAFYYFMYIRSPRIFFLNQTQKKEDQEATKKEIKGTIISCRSKQKE
jgi:hypothetical protein